LHTIGFASEGDTCTKSRDAILADSKADEKGTKPCFSPLAPIKKTSLALIFELIGVSCFF
jgi:hypothetical protein